MDVEQASASIDALIARRSTERERANALEAMWRASERRHREKIRRANRAAWFGYFSTLAENHRKLSEHFEGKAERLLEEGA